MGSGSGPLAPGSQQHRGAFSCLPGTLCLQDSGVAALPGGHQQHPISRGNPGPPFSFMTFSSDLDPGRAAGTHRASWLRLEGAGSPLENRLSPCPWQEDWQPQCPRLSWALGVSPGTAMGLDRPPKLMTSAKSRLWSPGPLPSPPLLLPSASSSQSKAGFWGSLRRRWATLKSGVYQPRGSSCGSPRVWDRERHRSVNCLRTTSSPRRTDSRTQRDITSHLAKQWGVCQEQAPGDEESSTLMLLA